jgi:hypothetical protein
MGATMGFLMSLAIILLGPVATLHVEEGVTSMYTSLSATDCRLVKQDEETGSSIQTCPGVSSP